MSQTVRLRVGQRVIVLENAREKTAPLLGWRPEMDNLYFRIGKIKSLHELGTIAVVSFPEGDFTFTSNSLTLYKTSSYKLFKANANLRTKLKVLLEMQEARVKGISDWESGKKDNPYMEEHCQEAWENGWEYKNEKQNLRLAQQLLIHLFRERQLTAVRVRDIEERNWMADSLSPFRNIINAYLPTDI